MNFNMVQILLAAFYGAFGFIKATQPIPVLGPVMNGWPSTMPEQFVRFSGTCERLGAFGFLLAIFPPLRPLARWAAPTASKGLSRVQCLAIPFLFTAMSCRSGPLNALLLFLSLLIVWGRGWNIPFQSKS